MQVWTETDIVGGCGPTPQPQPCRVLYFACYSDFYPSDGISTDGDSYVLMAPAQIQTLGHLMVFPIELGRYRLLIVVLWMLYQQKADLGIWEIAP